MFSLNYQLKSLICNHCGPHFCWGVVGHPTKFSKGMGRLTGSQFLEGFAELKEVRPSSGGCSFYIKNKIKSEIFNDKKSL